VAQKENILNKIFPTPSKIDISFYSNIDKKREDGRARENEHPLVNKKCYIVSTNFFSPPPTSFLNL
jgi:hypothetical protein